VKNPGASTVALAGFVAVPPALAETLDCAVVKSTTQLFDFATGIP
jgi:hypothetical protein